nr:hypothetical protein B0A51_18349 [Rachicladosporium sp. CCFEE 5018]
MPKHKVPVSITNIPPTSTCFLTDLIPPEIRDRTLRQLLIKRSPIVIRYIRPRGTPGEPENRYYISTHREHPHHPGYVHDRAKHRWVPSPLRFTALLQTCKLINTEATQVLYGSNEFSVCDEETLMGFLKMPGAGKLAIQKVRITGYYFSMLDRPTFWNSVLPLTNLRTITIAHSRLCERSFPRVSLEELQRLVMPLMKSLSASYDMQGLTASPVDVLQVQADFCEACNCTCEVRHKWPNGGKCPKPSTDRLAFDERHVELVRSVKGTLENSLRRVNLDSEQQPKKAVRRRLRG